MTADQAIRVNFQSPSPKTKKKKKKKKHPEKVSYVFPRKDPREKIS